jgi:hypothetical protein
MVMDDKAQMVALEGVFFTVIVVLSLVFLAQLSPSTVLSEKHTNILKIQGDSALQNLYKEPISELTFSDFPSNKIVYYIITNDYTNFTADLNKTIPTIVMYNIWISNETKTVFWCNSNGDYITPLITIEPIITSHYIIAIDPFYLNNTAGIFTGKYYVGKNSDRSDLDHPDAFQGYEGSTFNVILEMWKIP